MHACVHRVACTHTDMQDVVYVANTGINAAPEKKRKATAKRKAIKDLSEASVQKRLKRNTT